MSLAATPEASSSSNRLVSVSSATASSSKPNGATLNGTRDPPATPLRPIISPTGFTFPAIWSFPPFFTLQPNPSTLAHQLGLWTQLVLNWARHDRAFILNCDAADGGGEVFWNRGIKSHAAPDPPKQTSTYLLYWRKPEEWGQLIYDWVVDTGSTGSILTMYEITDGDLSHTTDFRQLPPPLLRKALDTLVRRGKAQLLKGEGEMGEGVRFL